MNLAWYVARAGGLVSWALLSMTVVWGLVISTKLFRSRARPAWMLDLHRFLGGFALLFTGLHIAGLMADTYVHFGPTEILIPFAGRWHPLAVAWGVASLYLLVAIEGTSLFMRRLSNRAWKRIHRTSFGLFVFATVHAIASGTDMTSLAARWSALLVSGTIVFLWLLRIVSARGSHRAVTRVATPARARHSTTPAAQNEALYVQR
jgi:predicted ferric reductase